LPPSADLESIRLELGECIRREITGTHDIPPGKPFVSPSNPGVVYWNSDANIQDGKDVSIYENDAVYPDCVVKIQRTGRMRKWKFVEVGFVPIQYNTVTGRLYLTEQACFSLIYDCGAPLDDQRLLYDTKADAAAAKMFANHDAAKDWYVPSSPVPLSESAESDYVIITTSAVESGGCLDNFINYKKAAGHSVLVKTVEEIEVEYGGQELSDKIRAFLKDKYAEWGIEYVLMVGDGDPDDNSKSYDSIGSVPMKMCWPRYGMPEDEDWIQGPTDYYYADLTGDWDRNGNGYYGEGSDGVDFTPEVYVGRIFSDDPGAIAGVLSKTITYDTTTTGIEWRNKVIMPMSFLSSSFDAGAVGEAIKNGLLTSAGYSHFRLYNKGRTSYSCEADLTKSNLTGEWSKVYGFCIWHSHGQPTFAAGTYAGKFFDTSSCSSLNDDCPAFVAQMCCFNGYPEEPNNLGWALLKHGAIGTISSSRVTWTKPNWDSANDGAAPSLGYYYTDRLLVDKKPAGKAFYEAKVTTCLWNSISTATPPWVSCLPARSLL
jgi:hypothetical protein